MSSRISAYSRDSRRQSVESTEIVYQELSIDDDLFTARVYKRNYRNNGMQYHSNAQQAKSSLGGNGIDYQISSKLPVTLSRCVWAASVDYLAFARRSAEVTIEGPSIEHLSLTPGFSLHKDSDCLPYPYVCKFVEGCDLKKLFRVLSLTTERFKEWKLCILYEACKQNNRDLVKALLDHGVWKDGYRPTGTAAQLCQTTPMHVAVHSAGVEIVELLIEETATMEPLYWEDENGYQPLHIACHQGSLMMVTLLIEAGANVNSSSPRTKDQPIHLATKYAANDPLIVSYLLKHGANPKAQTVQGDTALHLSCMNNSLDKMTALLAQPVLLETENHQGWTPLHVACRYGSLELIRRLLSAGSPNSLRTTRRITPLYVACTRGVLSVVEELLRWPHSKGKVDYWSESPLVVAVAGLNFPIVSRLLDGGYYPDLSSRATGKTILQHALSQPCFDAISVQHRRETIETLLASGANAGLSDLRGNTALHHWAMTNSFPSYYSPSAYFVLLEESRYSSLLHLLVQNGANIEAQNHNGETPIDLAFKSHNMRKVEALQLVGGKVIYGSLDFNLVFQEKFNYRTHYPEPETESFTKWKAGSIPRHDLPETTWSS